TGLPSGESRGCTLPAPHPGGGNFGGFWGRTILRRPGSTAEESDETEDDAGRSGGTRTGARADDDCPVHQGPRLHGWPGRRAGHLSPRRVRSEEHTSELQSPCNLVCRLLLE